ncbi:cation diffusion facilitator family transporter [Conyzicola lurida]|uniref:Cation diffusion facilitator family transporter n=1 Tax=Conyzicola lurida TaxID=1172621 RepID=A0A841AI56_9MICO|nr:cation transporter [Conyzicola lurida]MBB5843540.1 cation diffusion facilitator family transporter [Conyzicola lurida]
MAASKTNESTLTVLVAFGANLLIAIAKSVAALLTGSASIAAEVAHSWADTGNEIFLYVAERKSARGADATHPLGYGREAYVWSMYAAFGLFAAGAAVSVYHGVQSLLDPEPASDWAIAYVVLGVAFVLEGVSFLRAYKQARETAREQHTGTLNVVLESSNPTLRAVFAEDAAALIGLVIAFLGVLLHQLTGSPVYDAVGSILVGVLLAIVALVLINRNRRFLVGQETDPAVSASMVDFLNARTEIERVTYLHLEFVGPSRVFLVAAVDLVGNDTETHVAVAMRAVEAALETNPHIVKAVLTLSAPADASL